MITVKFTKKFVPGSLLEDITYDEALDFPNQEGADRFVSFLKKHANTPVKPAAGSAYIVTAISTI